MSLAIGLHYWALDVRIGGVLEVLVARRLELLERRQRSSGAGGGRDNWRLFWH